MFRKPPLRTYERKKGQGLSSTTCASSVVRADISEDVKCQPQEFLDFKDSDVSLEYDPFDTTFDRMLKETKMQLPSSNDPANDSSSDSDVKNNSSDNDESQFLASPWPSKNRKPLAKLGPNKKRRPNEKTETSSTKTPKNHRKNRVPVDDTHIDENTEPNVEKTIPRKRGRKKKLSAEPAQTPIKKKRRAEKKLTPLGRPKKGNINGSKNLKRCSVRLTRIRVNLDRSANASSPEKLISNDESVSGEKSVDREPDEVAIPTVCAENFDENRKTENYASVLKNSIVLLHRLSVGEPRRFVDDGRWISSTPIDRRCSTEKSSLRFSPIDGTNANENLNDPKSSRLKPIDEWKYSTPKNKKNATTANPNNDDNERSTKNVARILSDSPDSEPSRLMFEDTEVVAATIDDDRETKDSVESSTDAEPSRLILTVSDESALNEISASLEKTHFDGDESSTKRSSTINRMNSTNDESFPGSEGCLPNDVEINAEENRSNRSDENSKNRSSILDESSAKSRDDVTNESTNDRQNDFEETDEGDSKKLNSDDEWATISDSQMATISDSQMATSEKSSRQASAFGKSIEELSPDDDNSISDDAGKMVDASAVSIGSSSNLEKSTNFEVDQNDESSQFETTSESEGERLEDDFSIAEMNDEKSLADLRRNSAQPIVLLSRINVPFESKSSANATENLSAIPGSSTKSVENSTNDDGSAKKPKNDGETSEESRKWQSSPENESWDSQDDMESLKVDEIEDPSVGEVAEQDLSKGQFLWSMTEIKNASVSPSPEMQADDRENNEESVAGVEINANESTTKTFEENRTKDDRRDDQPIVLLTRLSDTIGVTDRRKRYRGWGLTTISENPRVKNVTTIEEEPEDVEFGESESNDTEKPAIDEEPTLKLNRAGSVGTMISQDTTVSCDVSVASSQGHELSREDKVLFLKPGKCWSRSLSLFRQVHNQDDIEALAVGKGKKWRQSVQIMMDMQQQGVIQSCVKKNENDGESGSCYGVYNNGASRISGCSQTDGGRVFGQAPIGSPGRFVRRVSIRVVPDRKNSQYYEDTPFLEAYGITTSENRKTLDERSALTAPRKTLVYNVQCQDVTFDTIPSSVKSVTSRDVVLSQCGQEMSLPFEECYPDSYLNKCRKIGEGVFGEVFLHEKGLTRSVIKIIPIEGDLKVNGERQKKFDEILSEIVIAKELNSLRFADGCKTSSFVEVKNIRCVVGKYPRKLVDLWKDYDDAKSSENDCPDMFDKNQLYIVLELGHGGQDLEAFVFQNSSEAHALFVQTSLALAVAEESLQFEHRDLHWGNLLISRTEESHVDYKLHGKEITVPSKGVKVSVIDFTLSRMSYQGCSIFNDLSLDDDLFAAQGEYQFEIYRLMRHKVENDWQIFEPYTNILWLHYTLDKMITAVRYRRTSSKIHKNGIEKLKELSCAILNYKSAYDFVTNCDKMARLQGSRSRTTTNASAE